MRREEPGSSLARDEDARGCDSSLREREIVTFEPWQIAGVLFLAGIVGILGLRQFRFRKVRMQLPELLKAGAVIVDVRTRGEFASGARKGSVNIPLDELQHGLKRLDRNKPIVLCCASGARSAIAARLLRQQGFERVFNVGSWASIPG